MAQRARLVGNALEYLVCMALEKRQVNPKDPTTSEKTNRLKRDFDRMQEPHSMLIQKYQKLDDVFDSLGVTSARFPTYYINPDNQGDSRGGGQTADIVLPSTTTSPIKLSIKNNNVFIKHQRPNKLHMQLGLDAEDAAAFQGQYKEINDRYYQKWHQQSGYRLFNQIPTEEKFALYQEINDLTISWMLKDLDKLRRYVFFVLDVDPDKYILKWDPGRTDFSVISGIKTSLDEPPSITTRDGSFIEIRTHDLLVKLRMHNARSRITPTLSLKYNTTAGQML